MCTYRVRCATFLALVALVWPGLLPPASAAAPELAPVRASVAGLAGHVIAITAAGLADSEVTVVSGSEVAWQNNTGETLQIVSGVPPGQIYLPLILRNSAGSMATGSAAQPPSALGAPRESGPTADWGGTVPPGGTYTHTFDVTGTYAYYVSSHLNWRGKIIVVDLPPDPVDVAPPVDPSIATDFSDATAFLYTGPNAIQTGVAPGTIKAQTAAVLRGKVTDRDGNPLSAVAMTVLGHPEYGQTFTRADGMFDLAVNGGGLLTLDYARDGYLPVQRQVDAPWRDYAWAPDVVLIPLDAAVTTVALGSGSMQVARGSVVTDADGSRRSTLLVPAGTGAQIVLPGGITQTMSALSVRATEYTVGDNGPQAMPAELPANVGYTYAFELSADEALAAGASGVVFDRPLPYYVENFLDFPAGTIVPLGYYDRAGGQWVASDSGRVVAVTGISGGLADLDTDGDGLADNGAVITPTMVITITEAERSQVASLYAAGTSLWRMPIPHFTPWDSNWAFSPPPDAVFPPPLPPRQRRSPLDDCPQGGSTIGCDSQTLGESVEIAGTSFRLHYASDRVKGRKDPYLLSIPLTDANVPGSLQSVAVEVDVAGRHFSSSYPAVPNQAATFAWDGQDAYGRTLQGGQPVEVAIGYVYPGYYVKTDRFGYRGGDRITGEETRQEVTLWQRWLSVAGNLDTLGNLDASGLGLGGWSLSPHHVYDPSNRLLLSGDGSRRSARSQSLLHIITTVAGNGAWQYNGDGMPATQAQISPGGVAVGPDGSLYIADHANHRIRRVGPDGIIATVAGTGRHGYNGDGIPATMADLWEPGAVAIGRDGSLYISDGYLNPRIRRVGPDGIITTVAGTGWYGYNGDGIPATQAQIYGGPVAVGPDGSLYIADRGRVRRVGPDGIITTVAGTGTLWYNGDGIPATQAQFDSRDVAVGPDGSLYIADLSNGRIRRVDPNGIITTVAGNGWYGYNGDGIPATQARLTYPGCVAVGADGILYIGDTENQRIRRVGRDGIITTLAGTGTQGYNGDGIPPTQAHLNRVASVAVGPDGALYLADGENSRVRRVAPTFPGLTTVGGVTLASEDGSEVYAFNDAGRHLRTFDPLTGVVLFKFGYDAAGRLTSIQDRDGNTTTVEHDANGHPTAIVGPFGQRTTLTVDANGYLASITDPAGNVTRLTSSPDGLLSTFTDPRGNLHLFSYDEVGSLIKDENPAGATQTLTRTETAKGHRVTVTTSLGASTTYETERLATGAYRRTVIDPAGAQTQTTFNTDGSRQIGYPDGTTALAVYGPDPRWGMQAPLLGRLTVTNPGGATSMITATRQVSLTDPANPFSLVTQTDTVTINGNVYTTTYTAATRTIEHTSAAGRYDSAVLDSNGRVTQVRLDPELDPISYTYDARGQITQVQQGTLSWSYSYDSLGRLVARADSDGREKRWGYDDAGRAVTMTLPGGETYGFARDASGNLARVTMPSGAVHDLAYTPVDRYAGYTPPGSTTGFTRTYDADGRLTSTGLPGGRAVASSYDAAGRPTGQSYAEAAASFAYAGGDPTDRVARMSRALTGGTSPQEIAATYRGSLLTGAIWTGVSQGAFTYGYNASYQPAKIRLVSGSDTVDLNLTRDADGLVTGYGPFTLDRSGPAGLVSRIADSAMTVHYGYDAAARPFTRTHTVNAQPMYDVRLTRDAGDRVTEKVETIGGVSHTYAYTYDANGQLLQVKLDGATIESYTYDANGNRTSRQVRGGTAESATYDSRDRLSQRGGTAYQVDADGYLKLRGSDAFSYSARGELLSATVGATTVTYAYDALGRRVGRTGPDGATQYLYGDPGNALQVTAVRDPSGALTTLYYDDEGHLYALRRGGSTYYVATDPVGTPRLVSDAGGQVVKALEFDSFGVPVSDSNPAFTLPLGFAGGLFDAVTGLVHFGFRDYEPPAGRWTSSDPALFSGGQGNLYAYVGSNPASFADPTGLFSIGGSGYAGVGGGAKISVTGEGMSVCVEVGFGVGGSAELDPFGKLDRSSATVKAEITANLRGLVKGGLQVQLDDCGDFSYRPQFCVGPFCTTGENLSMKSSWEKFDKEKRDKDWKEAFKGETKVQGKIAAVNCYQHRW